MLSPLSLSPKDVARHMRHRVRALRSASRRADLNGTGSPLPLASPVVVAAAAAAEGAEAAAPLSLEPVAVEAAAERGAASRRGARKRPPVRRQLDFEAAAPAHRRPCADLGRLLTCWPRG